VSRQERSSGSLVRSGLHPSIERPESPTAPLRSLQIRSEVSEGREGNLVGGSRVH
jgi:hypothetical protein